MKVKCNYFGRKFDDLLALDTHQALLRKSCGTVIHCAEDKYCPYFFSKHDLKAHVNTVHKKRDKNTKKLDLIPKKPHFECREFKKQMSSRHWLRIHLKKTHNITEKFNCKSSGCHQVFEKWAELKAHQKIHKQLNSSINSTIG